MLLSAATTCYPVDVSEPASETLPPATGTVDRDAPVTAAGRVSGEKARSKPVALLVMAAGFVTGTMGAVACLMRCMADGGLPAEDMNRALVSVMGKALGKPELGDGSCFRCAGNGEIVSAHSSAVCGVCRGTGRLVVGS